MPSNTSFSRLVRWLREAPPDFAILVVWFIFVLAVFKGLAVLAGV